MSKASAIFSVAAIILGLLFLIWATSQMDIDVGRKMAKWESRTVIVQEIPSVKVSEGD